MPSTPGDAKGLLLSAIFDDDPVVFLEHRWLYNIEGPVLEGDERVPIGQPRIVRSGSDITIAATSYMTIESLRAAELLAEIGIKAEVIDLRTLNPFDHQHVVKSVIRTKPSYCCRYELAELRDRGRTRRQDHRGCL